MRSSGEVFLRGTVYAVSQQYDRLNVYDTDERVEFTSLVPHLVETNFVSQPSTADPFDVERQHARLRDLGKKIESAQQSHAKQQAPLSESKHGLAGEGQNVCDSQISIFDLLQDVGSPPPAKRLKRSESIQSQAASLSMLQMLHE